MWTLLLTLITSTLLAGPIWAQSVGLTTTCGPTNQCGIITRGIISGELIIRREVDGNRIVSQEEARGGFLVADHATSTSDTIYTLPTALAGMSMCFYDHGGGDGGITLNPQSADVFVLSDGTTTDPNDEIDSPGVAGAGPDGDFLCIVAIDDGVWATMGMSGAWVDAGAP
jgi:hypothetical protein